MQPLKRLQQEAEGAEGQAAGARKKLGEVGRFHKQRTLLVSNNSQGSETFVDGCFTREGEQVTAEKAGSRQRTRRNSKQKKKKKKRESS